MGRGRVDFDHGIARLASYARYHGHANPKADEVWLNWSVGLWVANLRAKFRSGKLTAPQIEAALDTGVRFTPPYRDPKPKPPSRAERMERDYLKRLECLEAYFRQNGHINVPQVEGIDGWLGAGRWIARLRGLHSKGLLSQAVVHKAEKMGICWTLGRGRKFRTVRADE